MREWCAGLWDFWKFMASVLMAVLMGSVVVIAVAGYAQSGARPERPPGPQAPPDRAAEVRALNAESDAVRLKGDLVYARALNAALAAELAHWKERAVLLPAKDSPALLPGDMIPRQHVPVTPGEK
jgi:hypothetical protein